MKLGFFHIRHSTHMGGPKVNDLISHIPQVNYPLSHSIGHDSSGN